MSRRLLVVTEAMLCRLAHGWAPEELARRVESHFPTARGLDGKAVTKWERRFQTPRDDYAEALCQELDASTLGQLGLGRTLEAQAYWRLATREERDADVRRRQLLEDSLVMTGAVVLFPVDQLTKWANFYGQMQRIDPQLLGELEHLSTQIARKYAAGETATALPAARAQAYAVIQLLDGASMTPTQRLRLGSIGADAAAMQGVLELNMGNPDQARDSFDLALDLAHEARDARLEALIIATETWLWSPGSLDARATGTPQQAVDALAHACTLGQHAPAPAQVWLHAFRARDLAVAQDGKSTARALAVAQDILARLDPDGPGWGFFSAHGELAGFDGGRIHAIEGYARLGLGQHADAVSTLRQALDDPTMPTIKRCIIGDRLVKAWVGTGQPEPACAAGIAALDQATAAGFTLTVEQVRDIRATFPDNWEGLACVRELDERLRALA
jgi:tetratricopeptide (TPR) repeat protein